ncbi:MAG: hypothetical protein QF552_01135 [Litorilituus sp.]|jgi:hypothetical protein|nr:hypothetical protein [Litorilituus sp.]
MKKLILSALVLTLINACTNDLDNITTSQEKNRLVEYTCAGKSILLVSFTHTSSNKELVNNIAIINGFSKKPIILKSHATATGFLYSNAKYTLKGNDQYATWTIGRMAPINCWVDNQQLFEK